MRSSWHLAPALTRLKRIIDREAIDGIYAFGLTASLLADAAARHTKVGFTIFGHRGAIREKGAKLSLKRWISNRASVAIYNSNTVCAQATERFGFRADHAVVVRTGVDAQALNPNAWPRLSWTQLCTRLSLDDPDPSSAELVISTTSNLRPEKDHVTFLLTARCVVDRWPRARFLAIGDGPLLKQAEQLRDSLGLQHHVYFVGYRSDAAELVHSSDIFVLTSRTESMPSAILEAMALGKPVVATDVGGVSELVQNGRTGFLGPANEPEQIAEQLIAVMTAPALIRERLGASARAVVTDQFRLDRMIRETEDAVIAAAQKSGSRLSYSRSSTL
jgi:glycosyltransferase involved in cell wall biosynthesis